MSCVFRFYIIKECDIKAHIKALAISKASSDKKALDIVTIDMRKKSNVCDYFVISSGSSTTQVRAIADNIMKKMDEKSERLWHKEGERDALWILLDYGDVVAHVFLDRTRHFYDLERLWSDVPLARFKEARPKLKAKPARRTSGKKRPKRRTRRAKRPGAKRSSRRR